MKKKLIIAICALLVLGGAYYFAVMYQPPSNEQQKAEKESIVVFKVLSDDVTKIGIKNENDSYTFLRTDDTWKLENKDVELLATNVNSLCYNVSYIFAVDLIEENVKDLTIYGLDTPKAVLTVTTDTERTFIMGDLAPTGNYYYFADGSKVYTVTKTTGDVFLKTLNDYRSMTVININTDDVRGIKITGTEENLAVNYSPLPEGQSNAFGSLSVWKMTSPINYSVENEKFGEKVLRPACSITAENIVEDYPSDLRKYNLNKKVSIVLDDKTVSYSIGTSSGVYYVYPEGGTIVYAVAAPNLSFLDVKAIDILEKFLAFEMLENIESIDIETPGAKGTLAIKRGNNETYYLDKDIFLEEGAFKSMFQVVIGLGADGFMTKGYDKNKLLGTITYHYVKGGTKVLKFYPYDEINVAAEVDGNATFYMKKTKLSDLEGYLNNLRANPGERVQPR